MPKPVTEKEPAPAEARAFGDRHRNLLTVAVVGGLMLVEGAGLMVAVRYMGGGPRQTAAGEGGSPETAEGSGELSAELPLTTLMAFNSQDGRVFVYQMGVVVVVEARSRIKAEEMIQARQNTVDDRLGKLVRAADPKFLNEPGLETLRRQFKHELAQVFGDPNLIKEVLFPEFSATRAD